MIRALALALLAGPAASECLDLGALGPTTEAGAPVTLPMMGVVHTEFMRPLPDGGLGQEDLTLPDASGLRREHLCQVVVMVPFEGGRALIAGPPWPDRVLLTRSVTLVQGVDWPSELPTLPLLISMGVMVASPPLDYTVHVFEDGVPKLDGPGFVALLPSDPACEGTALVAERGRVLVPVCHRASGG